MMFRLGQAPKVGGRIIRFVFVVMVNFVTVGNFAVIVSPNVTINGCASYVVPVFVLEIDNAVETLVLIVDNFNDGRRSQITFENVNAAAFKIIVGVLAESGKRGKHFGRKLHFNHSLQKLSGIDTIRTIK